MADSRSRIRETERHNSLGKRRDTWYCTCWKVRRISDRVTGHDTGREESKPLGTDLVDKLAGVEVESLSVEMIGETKTLGNTWLKS